MPIVGHIIKYGTSCRPRAWNRLHDDRSREIALVQGNGAKPDRAAASGRSVSLLVAAILSALFLSAFGPKKPYEDVKRRIIVAKYWDDSKPANNIVPGCRLHQRGARQQFQSRTFVRFEPAVMADVLMRPDMKLYNLLKTSESFEIDGVSYGIDVAAWRRFFVAARSNPDIVDLFVFDDGFLVFAKATDDGFLDTILRIPQSMTEELTSLLKH